MESTDTKLNNNKHEGENFEQATAAKSHAQSKEVIRRSIIKYSNSYMIVCILLTLFEAFFAGRSILKAIQSGGFDDPAKRIIYLVCYVSLAAFSIVSAILMSRVRRRQEVSQGVIRTVYVFCIFLILWSTVISILDIQSGHSPIVFMTVIMGVAALAFIEPYIFVIVVSPFTAGVFAFCANFGRDYVASWGFLLNFIVFVIITFFIIYRQNRQNARDYEIVMHLEDLSYHDQLTGMKNRFALREELPKMKNIFYFGLTDFDNFKMINDVFGHDFGDECLCKGSALLVKYFGDSVYRYGGDEFVIITTLKSDEISKIGEEINAELEAAFPGVGVRLSGGFYLPSSSKETSKDYLKKADAVLYMVKEQDKGKFNVNK